MNLTSMGWIVYSIPSIQYSLYMYVFSISKIIPFITINALGLESKFRFKFCADDAIGMRYNANGYKISNAKRRCKLDINLLNLMFRLIHDNRFYEPIT